MLRRTASGQSTTRTSRALAGAMAALSTAAAAHAQTVLYVDDDAPAGGNGRSWGEAFNDLQDALFAASYISDDIEVRIADGLYSYFTLEGIRKRIENPESLETTQGEPA